MLEQSSFLKVTITAPFAPKSNLNNLDDLDLVASEVYQDGSDTLDVIPTNDPSAFGQLVKVHLQV